MWFLIKTILSLFNPSCSTFWFSLFQKSKNDFWQLHTFSTEGVYLCENVCVWCMLLACENLYKLCTWQPSCFTASSVLAVGARGWQEVLIKLCFTLWTFERGCGQKMAANYSPRMWDEGVYCCRSAVRVEVRVSMHHFETDRALQRSFWGCEPGHPGGAVSLWLSSRLERTSEIRGR